MAVYHYFSSQVCLSMYHLTSYKCSVSAVLGQARLSYVKLISKPHYCAFPQEVVGGSIPRTLAPVKKYLLFQKA